jgi:hypothetical protein
MSRLEAEVQASISATDEEIRAYRQKKKIERYWRRRGRIVQVRIVEADIPMPDGEVTTLYTLASDIVNGMPKRAAQ